MDPIHAAVLGAVQGLTEFLPISSSGHLIMLPYVLGWPEHSQTFDLALHLGTLVALAWFFWADWLGLDPRVLQRARSRARREPPIRGGGWRAWC